MSLHESQKVAVVSILLDDAKEAIDGIIQVTEDTLHRDMEFDRRKLRIVTNNLIDISRILESVVDRVELLERPGS